MIKPELLDRQTSIAKTDIVMVTNENNVTKAITGQNLKKDLGAVGRVLICNSIESTAEKVVTGPDITLEAGISFRIVFAAGNTAANMTINYNSSEAKAVKIYRDGTKVTPDLTSMQVGAMLEVYYDGTDFVIIFGLSDTGTGAAVGTLISQYKKVPISGYLYCDGSTFDETAYPALYLYLGTNVLPDYRECVMVGAEQNTTDTIVEHDVYTQGQFKDDQLQTHKHYIGNENSNFYAYDDNGPHGSVGLTGTGVSIPMDYSVKETNTVLYARTGTTTHGKQKAVYVYIKATSGLAENQQENVLNSVKNYTYSKYDTTTSAQKSFVKIGNVGTYTNILPIGAGTNVEYTENLQNTFTNILSVQVTGSSYAGRYPDAYWLNNNDGILVLYYTVANDSRLCYQVTGILKENYVEPF